MAALDGGRRSVTPMLGAVTANHRARSAENEFASKESLGVSFGRSAFHAAQPR